MYQHGGFNTVENDNDAISDDDDNGDNDDQIEIGKHVLDKFNPITGGGGGFRSPP